MVVKTININQSLKIRFVMNSDAELVNHGYEPNEGFWFVFCLWLVSNVWTCDNPPEVSRLKKNTDLVDGKYSLLFVVYLYYCLDTSGCWWLC